MLISQQFADLFITVSPSQIASFYSTTTGQLLHKQVLPSQAQLADGCNFMRHNDLQLYDEPSNQFFNQFPITLIHREQESDGESRQIRIIKLIIEEKPNFKFDISFKTLFSGILKDSYLGGTGYVSTDHHALLL